MQPKTYKNKKACKNAGFLEYGVAWATWTLDQRINGWV